MEIKNKFQVEMPIVEAVHNILYEKISPVIDFSYVLSLEELNDGFALACQSSLRSDIEIEVTLKNNRREK